MQEIKHIITTINKIINTIEESGGSIVAYELCSSIRNNRELVDENNPDVYDALAKKYLNIGCACMMNNDKRIQLIDEFKELNSIEAVYDIEDLKEAIGIVKNKKYNKYISNTDNIIEDLILFLEEKI